ncbi:Hypothetical predicted protein, partial [Olea europaea subsp. europaea]
MSEVLEMVNQVVEASIGTGDPQPPLRSTASMLSFEETEAAKGKRRFMDVKIRDTDCWVQKWSTKL